MIRLWWRGSPPNDFRVRLGLGGFGGELRVRVRVSKLGGERVIIRILRLIVQMRSVILLNKRI